MARRTTCHRVGAELAPSYVDDRHGDHRSLGGRHAERQRDGDSSADGITHIGAIAEPDADPQPKADHAAHAYPRAEASATR